MSKFHSSKPVILKNLRAAWLDIFTPGEGMNGGPPKFKFTGLMEKESEAAALAKKAMLEAATGLWGANATEVVKEMSSNSKALRNGNGKMNDDGSVREEYKDMLYVSASNRQEQRPQVIGPKRHNGVFPIIAADGRAFVNGVEVTDELGYESKAPYRGCVVNAKVTFVAGKSFVGNDKKVVPNQVFARIEAVQFVKDGIAFGAGPTNAEGFDDEEVEADASTAGDDDNLF